MIQCWCNQKEFKMIKNDILKYQLEVFYSIKIFQITLFKKFVFQNKCAFSPHENEVCVYLRVHFIF